MQVDRSPFYDPAELFEDVRKRYKDAVSSSERVDYLTFVPDGEPTLDVNLGGEISLLKSLGVPIGVITNASLLWREDVREDLRMADWVSVKVDAVREDAWRAINRPQGGLRLSAVLDGMLAFTDSFSGALVTETMLVRGINDGEACIAETAAFLERLHPGVAYLGIPTRPPAERSVCAPDAVTLQRAYLSLAGRMGRVEYLACYEGDDFSSTGDAENDILSITAVHPMREEAAAALLERAGAPGDLLNRLVARGDLLRTEYDGNAYFVRSSAGGRIPDADTDGES
jgi:wyosine [tRNA(Phe)-imidazoG37] synthetase (radical SAM superfamily)